MIKTTLKIDGMMCNMCEAHMNDAIRKAFKPDKVSSSHSAGETVIVSKNNIDETALRNAVEETGYKLISVKSEEIEKKRLFPFLKK